MLLVALPIAYFGRAITGKIALLQGDGWKQNFPLRVLAGRMIADGQLPLWNPYIYGGTPLMASVYPGVFYPPNWLFAILPSLAAMHIVVITTYHLALIGTYLFARRIGLDRLSSFVSGMVFTFGAFMIAHLEQTSRISAAAWLPWILLALEHLYQQLSLRWVLLGGLFIALQLFAGEPQMSAYTAMTAGAYALFTLCFREERSPRLKFVASLAALAAMGVLLSSIQLLPEWELLRQSDRSKISYEYFSAFSFPPRQIVTFIAPFFYGGAAVPPYYKSYTGEWNIMTTSGYLGLMALMLATIAIIGLRSVSVSLRRMTLFWLFLANLALVLSFGGYLPFGIHKALYHVPLYNIFRGSYRNFFELSFAMAVLAGIGVNYLRNHETSFQSRRTAVFSGAALVALFLVATEVLYVSREGRLSEGEAFIPIFVFCLSSIALILFFRFDSRWTQALLLIALLIDLGSFGSHYYWAIVPRAFAERSADPPAVQFIKSRERNLDSFRIISHSLFPFDYEYLGANDINFELTDRPNASVMRGVASVNGNDLLRPSRFGGLTRINGFGILDDVNVFTPQDRGLDLMSVKYLLLERRSNSGHVDQAGVHQLDYYGLLEGKAPVKLEHDGVRFSKSALGISSATQQSAIVKTSGEQATSLFILSNLADSTVLPDGYPVARIRLTTGGGSVIEREMMAGRHTSEWAYDRPDVAKVIKHSRAKIAENIDAEGFQSHIYLARFDFDRAQINQVEFSFPALPAQVQIIRASLYDATTKSSEMLSDVHLPPERWQLLSRLGDVEVYENLKRLPRAWFVSELKQASDEEALKTIKSGSFDPLRTALITQAPPSLLSSTDESSSGSPRIVGYEPQRIILETDHPSNAFLVLSENYYPGWKATIDGQQTPLYRVNYSLRGIAVPKGRHQIEFSYLPRSFRTGLLLSAIGAGLLLVGSILVRRSRSRSS